MAGRKNLRIYYRAAGHVPLWKVMEEGGFLEKHGLEMDLSSMEGLRRRAMEGLRAGEVDIISGNHHNLYARHALHGEPFVHIAQGDDNYWGAHWMVAGKGIARLEDLRGKRVVMDNFAGHNGLNVWLYLRQHGLEEGKDVELVDGDKRTLDRVRKVIAGEQDATFVGFLDHVRAKAQGANVVEVPTMPMISGVTITTTTTFVSRHAEEAQNLLLALIDAIHFFKTRRQETMAIIKRTCWDLLRLRSDEELALYYEHKADSLEPKPYPTVEAIQNVFALALKLKPEIKDFHPLALWDLHHLRRIDDSGYIDRLYAS